MVQGRKAGPPANPKPWYGQEPFIHLGGSALEELKQRARWRRCPPGAILFQEGEPAQTLWVIQKGWVRLVRRTSASKRLTLDLVTPRDGLCGLSAFSGTRYLASAVAATAVEAVSLPADRVRKPLRSNAGFAACVTGIFSHRFHNMARFYATAFAPVEQRIASVLLRLNQDFGSTLPVTRREVAELAGTTVETAIRVTNQMRKENLLRMKRAQVALVDPKALGRKLQGGGFESGSY